MLAVADMASPAVVFPMYVSDAPTLDADDMSPAVEMLTKAARGHPLHPSLATVLLTASIVPAAAPPLLVAKVFARLPWLAAAEVNAQWLAGAPRSEFANCRTRGDAMEETARFKEANDGLDVMDDARAAA
ncbi:hypothetical protein Vretimale_9176 [Volvox reticuliferus]|uniref:Uncharacterized protein n=1 Tax=Volvox reticuliferus TaxID=1737510 RepID=A0A8J4LPG2_9CHLO|nr:hypothetical protein Vretifemale_10029 [Volvox reticuliferus]GIM04630.1 hypothetical protein Vretimale_9176 [Volvox reticuliferus]